MARLLGRLQWVGRPMTGVAPFPASCYRTMYAGSRRFTRALASSTATTLLMGFPKHSLTQQHHRQASILFTDAIEATGRRF